MSASTAADRSALLGALAITVTTSGGLEASLAPHSSVPSVVHPWDGWPVPQSSRWVNACAAETTWLVFVAVPAGDAASAAEAWDAIHDALGPELAKLGQLSDVAVANWAVSPTEVVPVLQATLII